MLKPLMVMCCACRRLIDNAGNPILLTTPEKAADLAMFKDRAEADAFVKQHGWTVEDGNHRCPECSKDPQTFGPSYIDDLINQKPDPDYGAYLDASLVMECIRRA